MIFVGVINFAEKIVYRGKKIDIVLAKMRTQIII